MRTTIELPDQLVKEAMQVTRIKKKTELIRKALQNLVQQAKVAQLKEYYGKIDLDIDMDTLRSR